MGISSNATLGLHSLEEDRRPDGYLVLSRSICGYNISSVPLRC